MHECVCMLSHIWLFVTPLTVAHKAPLSMVFSRQEYWSGLLFSTPGDIPDDPGVKEGTSAVLAGSFMTEPPEKLKQDYPN